MAEWAMKRFWNETTVAEAGGGFTVHLDGRGVKTPAKAALVVPSHGFAEAMAAEWDAQEEQVDPTTMPFTKMANSAIDNVSQNFDGVAAMLADYAGTDLLCYRADQPAELVARQAATWDPLLEWAAERFGARLNTGAGVMHVAQPEDAVARLGNQLRSLTPFQLAATYDLVTIPGSLIMGLAAIHGQSDADSLWQAQRVDEDWQAEQWGVDEEAAEQAALKRAAYEFSFRAFGKLGEVLTDAD